MEAEIILPIVALEKSSRPGSIRSEVSLPAGLANPALSLAACLSAYNSRTNEKRAYYEAAEGHPPDRLFVSNTKPHQPVTTTTLARWLTTMMASAGIDTSMYKAHSSRSASATSHVKKGLSLCAVLKKGNWSEKSRTFQLFYNRA